MTDWDFLDAVCGEILRDVDDLAERTVARIRREFPEYSMIAGRDQIERVAGELRSLITGFRARRPPNEQEARQGEMLHRRRAEQGLPIEALLGAYNTGYDVVWEELRNRVLARDPAREGDLLPVVGLLLTWMRSITGTVAESYAAVTAARDESRLALAQTFVTGLTHGGALSEQVESAARGLGLDPAGSFQAVRTPVANWTSGRLHDLRRQLHGPAAVVVEGSTLTVVVQGVPAASVLSLLGERPVAGIGLPRAGLAGAAESLIDAERTLALAELRGTTVHFEQDWLPATLLPQASRLAPLIDSNAAREFPHLAEAVRAYAGHHFSITASAEALHVHANTVKYRLTRWQEITGWDPRSIDGLMRSLASMTRVAATP